MQKLSEMKFDDSQILNNEQQQAVLGGKRIKTVINIDGLHKDVWKDRNNNGDLDEGDVIKIRWMVIPTPPPGTMELDETFLNGSVSPIWCDSCEDWDNPSEDDECCDLPE